MCDAGYGDQYLNERPCCMIGAAAIRRCISLARFDSTTDPGGVRLCSYTLLIRVRISERSRLATIMSAMYSTISLPYNFLKQAPRREHSEHSGCTALRPPKRVSSLCQRLRSFLFNCNRSCISLLTKLRGVIRLVGTHRTVFIRMNIVSLLDLL